jgi:3-oxoacyl-[acyl-carrier protein] reductase
MSKGRNTVRVAVVTGAARGIGAAVAHRLARDGFAVGLIDRDACDGTVQRIAGEGGRAIGVTADIADEHSVESAFALLSAELGGPTVLVNNAGFSSDFDLADLPTEEWKSMLAVFLDGAFFATRAAQRHMAEARWGRVINISSVSALGTAGRAHYSTAKAGLVGFTKALALELGGLGVTVNAIAPGFIVSDMTAATARRQGRDVEEHQRIAAESIPVGRVGQPEDIAAAAAYFASTESGFVSGQVLYVAGGPEG